jgi:WD repeat-containing protein 68
MDATSTPAAGSSASAAAAAPSNTAGGSGAGSNSPSGGGGGGSDKKEIYTYEAPWLIYGMNWTVRPDQRFRVALGSFVEDYNNRVEVVQLNEETGKFASRGTFVHPYPTTKIMFCPDKTGAREDLLATTGDYLRIWKMPKDGSNQPITMQALLNNNKNSEFW